MFDASKNGSQLAIWMLPPIFCLLLAAISWGIRSSGDRTLHLKGTFFVAISSCGFALTLLLLGGNFAEYYRARNSLKRREYRVAEGVITEFIPVPPQKHSVESFKVDDGVHVRITYKENEILRVEVK